MSAVTPTPHASEALWGPRRHLWRYNPQLEAEGKNPFSLDSKEPQWDKFQDFLKGEVRFASLYKMFPDQADELLAKTEEFAKVRLNTYKRLAGK